MNFKAEMLKIFIVKLLFGVFKKDIFCKTFFYSLEYFLFNYKERLKIYNDYFGTVFGFQMRHGFLIA